MLQLVSFYSILLATLTNGYSSAVSDAGAKSVNIAQYPHQVRIIVDSKPSCGGVILTEKFVLTAASCFNAISEHTYVQIRYGFTSFDSEGTFQHREVSKITKHPLFTIFDYDIAVIELSSNFNISQLNAWPAVLPASGTTWADGTEVTVVGWGLPGAYNPYSVSLQATDLVITGVCSSVFGRAFTERMLCTSPKNFQRWSPDHCIGNVGEALVLKNGGPTNNSLVVGILLGALCTSCPYASVYTNIANREINGFITDVVQSTVESC